MRKRTDPIITLLFIIAAISSLPLASAQIESPIISENLTITVYLDGFVLVTHELETNQTYPTVNITMVSREQENLLFLDDQSLPLTYQIANGKATVNSLGTSKIKATYLTQELTNKTSKYWTLNAQVSTNTTVIMPENTTIISLNTVPQQIESTETQIRLLMPPGTIEITYIADHSLTEQTSATEPPWPIIASILILATAASAFTFWMLKHRRTAKPKTKDLEQDPTADLDKLLEREEDLRQEELQVIHFLAEKKRRSLRSRNIRKTRAPKNHHMANAQEIGENGNHRYKEIKTPEHRHHKEKIPENKQKTLN